MTSLKILFLSDYDPRLIGLWYYLHLYQVLAIRKILLNTNNELDELCYLAAIKKLDEDKYNSYTKKEPIGKLIFTPYKDIKEIPKHKFKVYNMYDVVKVVINEV